MSSSEHEWFNDFVRQFRARLLARPRPAPGEGDSRCPHTNTITDGGLTGDAIRCLDCGRDKYPEVF